MRRRITALIALPVTAVALAACSSSTRTVTVTVTVPGPTVVKTVQVPGPAVTVTVTAPPPPAGTVIGKWSGTGNENTPAFNAPASGDYVVSWSYSGNDDPSFGGATNFSIQATDSSAEGLGLPDDIAASGSGSTEVTNASGVESFNVDAVGSWTITVKSAA